MRRAYGVFLRHPTLLGYLILAGLAAFVVLHWDWNWLRPLVAREASIQLGRAVTLTHFDVQDVMSGQPLVVLDGIAVGNPPDFPQGSELGTVQRLSLRFDALTYIKGRGQSLVIHDVTVDQPRGDLRPGPKGNPNWEFDLPSSGGSSGALTLRALTINDGSFHILDPRGKADITIAIHTIPAAKAGDEPHLTASAHGTYAGHPVTATFEGGSLLALRDVKTPYPVNFQAVDGATHISIKGTIQDPIDLAGANLEMDVSGDSLADLYPILGVPLAPTPPFRLGGHLDYAAKQIKFDHFSGTVGQSDLNGDFDVALGGVRPHITADLASNRVDLADLGGFIGAAPGSKDSANLSPQQKQEHTAQAASPDLFPDTPINVPEIKVADFDVHYRGKRIEGESVPLDNLDATLSIKDGTITLTPLNFGVGTGKISSNIVLNPSGQSLHAKVDVAFQQVDFHRLMQSTKIFDGVGVISGSARIDGNGDSLAAILARGDGDLKLYMTGGDVSTLMVDLAGLDFGRSVLAILGIPENTAIRCMISDFGLSKGILDTRALIMDTKEANIIGSGTVDLQNQTVNYKISQDPKHFSIGALHAPIDVTGLLKDPSVKPDVTALGARAGIAGALGVVLTPLAALIPTIQLGTGEDHDCADLVQSAKAGHSITPKPRATPKAAPEEVVQTNMPKSRAAANP